MTDDYTKIRELLLHVKYDEVVALGEPAIPYLIDALKDENERVRPHAAEALGEIAEKGVDCSSAVPALIDALKDGNEWARANAAYALGKIKNASAVPALIDALKDEYSDVRWKAAGALGKIKDASTVPALSDALKDENERVRPHAAEALGEIAEKGVDCSSAVPALIDALKDESWYVRSGAVRVLVKIGPPAVPALIDALLNGNKYRDVWSCAAEALGKIAEKPDIDLRAVKRILKEYVDSVKRKGDSVEMRQAKKEALGYYMKIAAAARKRSAERHSLTGDGIMLLGEIPRPPSGKKGMYRQVERRAFA